MSDEVSKVERRAGPPSRVAAAGVGAVAGLVVGGPIGAILGAIGIQSAVEATGLLWDTVRETRQERSAVPLAYAAHVSGATIEELAEQVRSDPDLLELFGLISYEASATTLQAKLLALGRVLANVLEDKAKLDLDYTIADALGVVEPAHLKVLAHLDRTWRGQAGEAIEIYALHEALPELGLGLRPILSALLSKALVAEQVQYGEPARAPRLGPQQLPLMSVQELRRLWTITEFGHDILGRITAVAGGSLERVVEQT